MLTIESDVVTQQTVTFFECKGALSTSSELFAIQIQQSRLFMNLKYIEYITQLFFFWKCTYLHEVLEVRSRIFYVDKILSL